MSGLRNPVFRPMHPGRQDLQQGVVPQQKNMKKVRQERQKKRGNIMTDHASRAEELFRAGYNCAQAVACAFGDVTGLDTAAAARMASSFGGGMGRLREVCGAVSGALLVLGVCKGYDDPADPAAKVRHYRLVQEFARRFRAENGSLICRELLKNVPTIPGDTPELRTKEFYERRPCLRLIRKAAQITDELLMQQDGSHE